MKIEELIKKYKTIAKVSTALSGKKVKYVSSTSINSGAGIPSGEIITIIRCNNSLQAPYYGAFTVECSQGQRTVYGIEMQLNNDTIESIQEEIQSLEKSIKDDTSEIKILKSKIEFMQKNNLKEFDETDFTVYAVLDQLEDPTLTKVERAQAIAKLIKG